MSRKKKYTSKNKRILKECLVEKFKVEKALEEKLKSKKNG